MKNLSTFSFIVLLSATILVACNKERRPETVAKEFLYDLYNQKIREAKELATEESQAKIIPDSDANYSGNVLKRLVITISKVEIVGNEAYVTYTFPEAGDQQIPPLKLVKQNNKWLISL